MQAINPEGASDADAERDASTDTAPTSGDTIPSMPSDGTSQLNAALGQLGRVLRSFIVDRAENMSGLQLAILSKLRRDTSVRLTEIAAAIPCDLSVASRQAMLLVERGLAAKTRDPDDGRALRFTLTAEGVTAIDESTRARRQWLDEQLAGFDDAQRACAAEVIEALVPAFWRLKGRRFGTETPEHAETSAHTEPPDHSADTEPPDPSAHADPDGTALSPTHDQTEDQE